jgi:alanine racemase
VELRKNGVNVPILISFPLSIEEVKDIVDYSLIPVISDSQFARTLSKTSQKLNRLTQVHLNIDLDTNIKESTKRTIKLIDKINSLSSLNLNGINYEHSPLTEETQDTARLSYAMFQEVCNSLENRGINLKYRQGPINIVLLNSHLELLNLVRSGSLIYGIVDTPAFTNRNILLKPVFSLKTRISHLHKTNIYPATTSNTEDKELLVSTIYFGITDGLATYMLNGAEVLIKGQRARILGNDNRDMYQVDTTHIPNIKIGDEVVIIGQQQGESITIEEIAKKIDTIGTDILFQINKQIPKVYKNR